MNKSILKLELVINAEALKQTNNDKQTVDLLIQRANLKDLLIAVLEEENDELQKAG